MARTASTPHKPPRRFPALTLALSLRQVPRYVIAAEARIAPNVLSQIEAGRREPTADQMARLADVLDVDVAELFDGAAS